MIDHLDNLIRTFLLARIPTLNDESQVRFQPPDEDWRTYVATLVGPDGLPALALNVYLADLRENRTLRSNERTRIDGNGSTAHEPAPARLDCHYIITSWSPAQPSPAVEPTLDEHELLYEVAGVFLDEGSLNPSRVYPAGSAALAAVPDLIRTAELPIAILPVDGFAKLPEFWTTMGEGHRWKPPVYLNVTLPVALERRPAGPLVTTRIMEFRRTGELSTAEVRIEIGGTVFDASTPVPGAWVRLETPAGDAISTTESNPLGRFAFSGLRPGQYRLRWRAGPHPESPPRNITVPSETGEYDLRFP
jgi:hypothetical protein